MGGEILDAPETVGLLPRVHRQKGHVQMDARQPFHLPFVGRFHGPVVPVRFTGPVPPVEIAAVVEGMTVTGHHKGHPLVRGPEGGDGEARQLQRLAGANPMAAVHRRNVIGQDIGDVRVRVFPGENGPVKVVIVAVGCKDRHRLAHPLQQGRDAAGQRVLVIVEDQQVVLRLHGHAAVIEIVQLHGRHLAGTISIQ